MKVCFLNSAGGGNLKFFYLLMHKKYYAGLQLYSISDRDCPANQFGKQYGIPSYILDYSISNNAQLVKTLQEIQPDLIVTNWHKIIDSEVVAMFVGKMINLHYSLLPSFSGLIGIEPIKQAYDSGCKIVGVTTHYVSDIVDAGEIIVQASIPVEKDFSLLVERVFRLGCLALLNTYLLTRGEKQSANYSFAGLISPESLFDSNVFDEMFWGEVKAL